ncbi:homeobox and leucine zipper protein Homez [Perognathus longimembris pacificus]|uniref:homeobox and leucine zipper protein Homez n=1 Tax=Perognathus longimembris pacificus TaxID=214514 RepID=UPI0020192D07|nr:homeobox and leucine zipper protein Homez [Perognathus longimembris pacificus]
MAASRAPRSGSTTLCSRPTSEPCGAPAKWRVAAAGGAAMPPGEEAGRPAGAPAGLVCLPPLSEEVRLVWTPAAQTSELDGHEQLLRTFSHFPYPSLADLALLCLRCALPVEKVKAWFMAQRLRCGISWSAEEIEETRARVLFHRDQLHFRSLLPFAPRAPPPPPPGARSPRKAKRKTKEQLAVLKAFFLRCQWARREDYLRLQRATGLPRPEIIQWFGDTRYALKHGQLRWFRENAAAAAPGPARRCAEPPSPAPAEVVVCLDEEDDEEEEELPEDEDGEEDEDDEDEEDATMLRD